MPDTDNWKATAAEFHKENRELALEVLTLKARCEELQRQLNAVSREREAWQAIVQIVKENSRH